MQTLYFLSAARPERMILASQAPDPDRKALLFQQWLPNVKAILANPTPSSAEALARLGP